MRKRDEIAQFFSSTQELDPIRAFFLVGIGGAGMSALARLLARQGYEVQGSDSTVSAETHRLIAEGIEVHIGHTAANVTDNSALVVTDAIDLDTSPEVRAARQRGLPIFRRSQALGWALRDKRIIAVTGTHGKTTTTGMLGAGLIASDIDPLVIVGANVPEWNGPIREGNGEWAVVEACEAYDAFHDLQPTIVVLTNLELDHVDFHGSYENLRESVVRFTNRIPADGFLVYCGEDRGACEVAELSGARAISYGLSIDWGRQMANKLGLNFSDLHVDPTILGVGKMSLPGRHNALNACGALMAGGLIGADLFRMMEGVREFTGAERRLQTIYDGPLAIGSDREAARLAGDWLTVIDDYAHHPSEIAASLAAVRERYFGPGSTSNRLIVVYQPHLYSRTAPLIAEFAETLSAADLVVITDIYPAREAPIPGVSSARIAERVTKNVRYVPSRHLLAQSVAGLLKPGDVVVGMGAGNISEFAPKLIDELESHPVTRNDYQNRRITVLYGGDSAEREVSLLSGRAIAAALKRLGHRTRLVDMTERLYVSGDLSDFVGPNRPDLVFLAVHGTHAEDGAIQGLLELLHVPYTGSGIQASAIAMDKELTKRILTAQGIRMPRGVLVQESQAEIEFAGPWVVKPNAQGSTVGLSFVTERNELAHAIHTALSYDTSALVEEWIVGMEISTPVLGGVALMPVEIAPNSGIYDFESKYTPGATQEIVPARLPDDVISDARRIALEAHRLLGCVGATRTDAIVRDGEIFVLEVNTLPGMTGTSLLPNSARAAGIDFDQLCQRHVVEALERYAKTS